MTDYAARRTMMVDTQVRPSDVTKFPIIDAMLSVPREAFVPTALLDALEIENDDLVLDVGSVYGYSAAVIARMAEAVVAVEDKASVVAEAQRTLSEQGADNVVLHEGPLGGGAPEHGPYDVITLQGAVEHLPEGLVAQLKEGGRMACLFHGGCAWGGADRLQDRRAYQLALRLQRERPGTARI